LDSGFGRPGKRETTLGDHSKEAQDRAQAIAEREEQRRARIAADHEAEGDAVRENTARLKSLRLTKAERTGEENGRSADKAIPVEKLNASNDD
jgi:CRISPR/Cas system CMR subunit Cmr4 (Cas7 group RAMP superfamily)